MSEIIDLSQASRLARRADERKRRKAKRREVYRDELVQVGATTVGQFVQIVQRAMQDKFEDEHFQFLIYACNYQLTCFARAYGWDVKEEIPISISMEIALDPEIKQMVFDFQVEGVLGQAVMMELGRINPGLMAVPASAEEPEGV